MAYIAVNDWLDSTDFEIEVYHNDRSLCIHKIRDNRDG